MEHYSFHNIILMVGFVKDTTDIRITVCRNLKAYINICIYQANKALWFIAQHGLKVCQSQTGQCPFLYAMNNENYSTNDDVQVIKVAITSQLRDKVHNLPFVGSCACRRCVKTTPESSLRHQTVPIFEASGEDRRRTRATPVAHSKYHKDLNKELSRKLENIQDLSSRSLTFQTL